MEQRPMALTVTAEFTFIGKRAYTMACAMEYRMIAKNIPCVITSYTVERCSVKVGIEYVEEATKSAQVILQLDTENNPLDYEEVEE